MVHVALSWYKQYLTLTLHFHHLHFRLFALHLTPILSLLKKKPSEWNWAIKHIQFTYIYIWHYSFSSYLAMKHKSYFFANDLKFVWHRTIIYQHFHEGTLCRDNTSNWHIKFLLVTSSLRALSGSSSLRSRSFSARRFSSRRSCAASCRWLCVRRSYSSSAFWRFLSAFCLAWNIKEKC